MSWLVISLISLSFSFSSFCRYIVWYFAADSTSSFLSAFGFSHVKVLDLEQVQTVNNCFKRDMVKCSRLMCK